MTLQITLKNKLMITSVCLCVIPVLIIGCFSVIKFYSFTQKTINKSYTSLENQAYSSIRTGLVADIEKIHPFLIRAEELVAGFSKSPSLNRLANVEKNAISKAKKIAHQTIEGLLKACKIHYQMIKDKLDQGVYAIEFISQYKIGSIYLSTNEFNPWSYYCPYTQSLKSIQLPVLYFGTRRINKFFLYEDQFSPIVDEIQEMIGVNCSIFQIINNKMDLLRVATNIRSSDGKRAIEELIPALDSSGKPNPMITALIKTGQYRGLTYKNNEEFFSIYKTLYNDSGTIIGAISVSLSTTDEKLNNAILNSKISNQGNTFVLNSEGRIVIHPNSELINKNYITVQNIKAYSELLINKNENDIQSFIYNDNNHLYLTAYIYFKPRDWIICVSDNIDHFINDEKLLESKVMKKEIHNIYQSSTILIQKKSYPLITQIKLLTPKGEELLSHFDGSFQHNLTNRSKEQWFNDSLRIQNGNIRNFGVMIDNMSGKEVLRITSPVYDSNQLKYLLVFDFDWELVKQIHQSRTYAKTGYSLIINEKGDIISHPRFCLKDHKNLCHPMFGELAEIARKEMISGKNGQQRYQRNGIDYYIYYMPLNTNQIHYCLAATGPVNEFISFANRIKKDSQQELDDILRIIFLSIIICIVVSMGIGLAVSRSIQKPIDKTIKFASAVSKGDLSNMLKSKNKDEVGYLLTAINKIVLTFRKIVKEITSHALTMMNASEVMVNIAGKLSLHSEKVSEQTTSVTETSESMTENISIIAQKIDNVNFSVKTISENTETVSINIDLMSNAIKSMSSSMAAIGKNAYNGQKLAIEAVNKANKTGDTMFQLSMAADEIGGVTQTIKRLAYKTNLIAINASIEASAAGDAGRGFQVLAKNIQDFAEQSNLAAEGIAMRISSVQENVSKAITEIKSFSKLIKNIHSSSDTIVSSVDEQIKVSDDISSSALAANDSLHNIVQLMVSLSRDSNEISLNISNISTGALDVSQSIKSVNQATQDNHNSIKEINLSAIKLDRLAVDLKKVVSDFNININPTD